jgi:hypothetical protein
MAPEAQTAAIAQERRQVEGAVCGGTPGEDVIRDRAERKDISLRGALLTPFGGLWRAVDLRGVGQVFLDVQRAGRRPDAADAALAAACDLPVGNLQPRRVVVGVPNEHVLRGKAAMIQALAMGVGHRLAKLAQQSKLLEQRQRLALLREIAVEPTPIVVILEDQCWPKFGLAVVEDALDTRVLHAFQHPELPLSSPGEAIPGLG